VTTYDELRELQRAAASAAAAAAAADAEAAEAAAALAALRAQRGVSPGLLRRAEKLAALARAATLAAAAAAAGAAAALVAALDALPAALDPAVPLLLLPVRLETRFRGTDLLVRVYPDQVHLDGHQPELTEAEVRAGQEFWRLYRSPDADPQGAWSRLADRVGATRAAWVARQLTPRNAPGAEPDFPTPPTRAASYARPTQAAALPDRWVALGYRGGARVVTAPGGLVRRPLPASPAGAGAVGDDPADDGIRWMADFGDALDAGMALTVPLPAPAADGLDLLLVVGVQGSTTADEAADALAALLDAHRYTAGLDLVPQGTPTNNTPAARSGRSVRDPGGLASYPVALGPERAAAGDGSDAAALAAALGLAGRTPFPLGRLAHAGARDQADAADLATLLWPGTWGYYLGQLVRDVVDEAGLERWRRFVRDTVRGRGPLPALRAGDQPYGVLPVTALDRWRPDPDLPDLVLLVCQAGRRRATAQARVLWDLGADGGWTGGWQDDPARLGLLAPCDLDRWGAGVLAAGVDPAGGGLLLATGTVDAAGALTWADPEAVPEPAPAGLGMATTGEDVLLVLDGGTGRRREVRVRVGTGLRDWLDPVPVPGVTPDGRVAGAAVADLDGDGRPDLLVLELTGAGGLAYRVGRGLDGTGAAERWTRSLEVPVALGGVPLTGAAVALADVDGDGAPELLVAYTWNGSGAYLVGDGLDADGRAARWLGPYNTGSGFAAAVADLGLAVAPVGRGPQVTPATASGLVNLAAALRGSWAGAVPRVGAGDPDQVILELLATDATSRAMAGRPAIGPALAGNAWHVLGQPLDATYAADLAARAGAPLLALGLPAGPRLATLAYTPQAVELAGPLVQDAPTSEDEPPADDYLGWLATATPQELHDGRTGPKEPLLCKLARHSLLQAYADAALRLVPVPGPQQPPPEPELIDLADLTARDPVTPPHTWTSWRHLSEATYLGRPVAEYLYKAARQQPPAPEVAVLAELLAALERLSGRPSAALERALSETLDLATHRLDGWLTAVATDRLRGLRARRPDGVHLGGFGLLLDLRPAAGPASTGMVHAPSVGHAATAAVLRSGFLSHGGGALAVDLSSARVRLASTLIEGVRAGQPLAALLGYRFERGLHDTDPALTLERYLGPLRQLAPQVAGALTPTPAGTPVEAVAAAGSVDGLALLRRWTAGDLPWGTAVPGQPQPLPATGTPEQKAIDGLLAELSDAVDALADLAVAEGVHHALQGNPGRAGASLDALFRGEVPPPDPEVVRSARGGTGVVHRVLLLLSAPLGKPWPATAAQADRRVRAAAEPRLDGWAAGMLGDPTRVRWRARYDGAPDATFTLADAGLSPLDVLYVGPTGADSDLGRILSCVAGEGARVLLDRDLAWGPDVLSVEEILEVAAAARALVDNARAADARDLAPTGLVVPPGADAAELATRAAAARAALANALADLRALYPLTAAGRAALAAALPDADPAVLAGLTNLLDLPPSLDIPAGPGTPAGLRDALLALAAFGIPGAAPAPDGAPARQARTVAGQAAGRLAEADAAGGPGAVLTAVFGPGFRVLPHFRAAAPDDVAAALAARRAAGDADWLAVQEWLAGVAQVRDGAARLHEALLLSGLTGGAPAGTWQVAQLPPPAPGGTDRWAALPGPVPGGLTNLALLAPDGLDPQLPLVGLYLDDWVEVVPAATEDTAVAFHLDAPGAAAPQSALLAVSPDPSRRWDLDTLEAVLLDTVAMIRLRAVDPDAVRTLGHLLPALLFAHNAGGDPAGDTVSTTFWA
jgi:hypothetical protein